MLSNFRYVIEHLAGELNVLADMLTRWAVRDWVSVRVSKLCKLKALFLEPISPYLDVTRDWPRRADIMNSQSKTNEVPRKKFEKQNGGLISEEKFIWIPGDDYLLKFRIIIVAHCGIGGHLGYRTTKIVIRAHFWWNTLAKDVKLFVRSCLHCLATETGKIVL